MKNDLGFGKWLEDIGSKLSLLKKVDYTAYQSIKETARMAWHDSARATESRLREPQLCGHPAAAIKSTDEGTSHCAWCEEVGRLEDWVADLQAGMYVNCIYCGHRYGPEDDVPATMADVLKEHIEHCPEHPASKLRVQRTRLQKVLYAWIEFKRRWWTNIPLPGGQSQGEAQRQLMEETVAVLSEIYEPPPFRPEYCQDCYLLACDFYDGDCTRQTLERQMRDIDWLRRRAAAWKTKAKEYRRLFVKFFDESGATFNRWLDSAARNEELIELLDDLHVAGEAFLEEPTSQANLDNFTDAMAKAQPALEAALEATKKGKSD